MLLVLVVVLAGSVLETQTQDRVLRAESQISGAVFETLACGSFCQLGGILCGSGLSSLVVRLRQRA